MPTLYPQAEVSFSKNNFARRNFFPANQTSPWLERESGLEFDYIGGVGRELWNGVAMEFWPEFLASSWGREFVAGGLGGMAGVISGHPLDTLRIRLQQPASSIDRRPVSAVGLLRSIVASEGPTALYRGMAAPLASVTFQVRRSFQFLPSTIFSLSDRKRN